VISGRLLANPGGLSSFLSTTNYALYVLAYLHTKAPPLSRLSSVLLGLLNYRRASAASSSPPAKPFVSPLQSLGALISSARTTLRLLGLPPLYVWLRTLLRGPKPDQDRVLYAIALAQCLAYVTYQALENVAVLIDNNVLSKDLGARLLRGGAPVPTQRIYRLAYRAWLVGVLCDLPRLAREAHLERERRANRTASPKDAGEDDMIDAKWWRDLLVPCAWLPVSLHFNLDKGLPGMNLGIMGLCGAVAGSGRMAALWAATKDV